MSTGSLSKSYADALHDMVQTWIEAHPNDPIDHEQIALEVINSGDWRPQKRNLIRELARHLAKVTGAQRERNEQGEVVKKYHAARVEVVIGGKKVQKTFWADRKKMSANHAHISFRQEWEQIAGHCRSLNTSQTDFNVNNPNACGNESQLQFDFTMIVDAPAEQQVARIAATSPEAAQMQDHRPGKPR